MRTRTLTPERLSKVDPTTPPSCPACLKPVEGLGVWDSPEANHAHNVYRCADCGAVGIHRVWSHPGWTWVAADGSVSPAPAAKPEPKAEPEAPAARPSPPSARCRCREERRPGTPRVHERSCPDYSEADHAWCLSQYVDARTNKAPTYAEALAELRRAARPEPAPPICLDQITCERARARLVAVGAWLAIEELRRAAKPEPKAKPKAEPVACECPACMPRVEVPREALWRALRHVQALDLRAVLPPGAAVVLDELRREVEAMAAGAGVTS